MLQKKELVSGHKNIFNSKKTFALTMNYPY